MPSLLLVHAHPDDEVIATGSTIAKYAATGTEVTLVTCTQGEEGEILVSAEAHRAADQDDTLAEVRQAELADALAVLGIQHHFWLGGPGKYRDSGMMGTPANDKPGCFWAADLDEATRDLVAILRQQRPEVVITYDEFGGYGHPDHIRANQVTVAALEVVGDETFSPELGEAHVVQKLYYAAIPKSWLQAGIEAMKAAGIENMFGVESADELPFGVADDVITAVIDGSGYADDKLAAMRAYPTQISTEGGFFALSDGIGKEVLAREAYILAYGATGELGEDGWESDLFSGVV